MTDSKHTPGPWYATGGLPTKAGRNKVAIGSPSRRVVDLTEITDEDAANAALIAAAPELLAALKIAVQRIDQLAATVNALAKNPRKVRAADFDAEIRSAIAKAEG